MPTPNLPAAIEELWVDPADAAYLYEHCVRCLYLHAHGWTRIEPSVASRADLVEGTMRVIEAGGRSIELEDGVSCRVLSQRRTANSVLLPFTGLGIALGFSSRYDAILELPDGRRVLVKYAVDGDGSNPARIALDLALHGFTLGHPADALTTARIGLDGYGILHFGFAGSALRPRRLTEIGDRAEGLLDFIRVLARVAARSSEPAASPLCPRCERD